MLVIDQWFILLLCTLFVLMIAVVVHEIVKPGVLRAGAESECEHQFTAYKNDARLSKHNYTFFCSRCGAVRQGGDLKPGFKVQTVPVTPNVSATSNAKKLPKPKPKRNGVSAR